MLILAIDTSTRTGSVALLRDNEVLAEVSGNEETPYSSRFFRDLEPLKSNAQFRMEQIDVFAVASGPGSFTGLRVGLTAVKAWAEVHGKPIAAISGLEAIAAQSKRWRRLSPEKQILAPFFDARRGQFFGALYRRRAGNPAPLELVSEESIFSAEEFLELVKKVFSWPADDCFAGSGFASPSLFREFFRASESKPFRGSGAGCWPAGI